MREKVGRRVTIRSDRKKDGEKKSKKGREMVETNCNGKVWNNGERRAKNGGE